MVSLIMSPYLKTGIIFIWAFTPSLTQQKFILKSCSSFTQSFLVGSYNFQPDEINNGVLSDNLTLNTWGTKIKSSFCLAFFVKQVHEWLEWRSRVAVMKDLTNCACVLLIILTSILPAQFAIFTDFMLVNLFGSKTLLEINKNKTKNKNNKNKNKQTFSIRKFAVIAVRN